MRQNVFSRRQWLKLSVAAGAGLAFGARHPEARATTPIPIGSRRELFVDDFLIERLSGAELTLHRPQPREVVLVCDAPWEGNTSAYFALFQDDDRFRVYYRGAHHDELKKRKAHEEVACYAESTDGITWTKPKLGLFEFNGSKDNNIVWTGTGSHNFTPFKDANPACSPDARYKAFAGGTTLVNGKKKPCLNAFQSADGIRWMMLKEAVITAGAFDSQNLAFWDAVRGEYRAYWRIFTAGYTDERGWKPSGVRAIRTATSKDFVHWENQADLKYVDSPPEHLYTNAVMPYFRAPHLFIGFPTRFQPKTQQVEPVFMTSRDGVLFRRWNEPLIPITAPQDRDGNRSNYMAWGLLQLPGQDRELSVYAKEAYYKGPGSRLRRFTFRTDGFASVRAPTKGELLTKPLSFTGKTLELNATGTVRIEIRDADGKRVLNESEPITGDHIACVVKWKRGDSLAPLAGKPVRVRFELNNADLFSFRFL